MIIKSSERLFVSGKTGSGKTYWIKSQISQLKKFILYDAKHDESYNSINATLISNINDLRLAIHKGINKIIYRPFMIDDIVFNEICRIIFETGNITFIIDEMAFHVSSNKIQPYHDLLMRLGRTKGIGTWNCTQRTRDCLHNTILSETDHIICFRLMLETDRKKLAESFDPLFYQANTLQDFNWIYYNTRENAARIMPPIHKI